MKEKYKKENKTCIIENELKEIKRNIGTRNKDEVWSVLKQKKEDVQTRVYKFKTILNNFVYTVDLRKSYTK